MIDMVLDERKTRNPLDFNTVKKPYEDFEPNSDYLIGRIDRGDTITVTIKIDAGYIIKQFCKYKGNLIELQTVKRAGNSPLEAMVDFLTTHTSKGSHTLILEENRQIRDMIEDIREIYNKEGKTHDTTRKLDCHS